MPAIDNAHALVVGIAGYHYINELPAVQDAPDIAAILTDPARCGYRAANVRLLLDSQATLSALREGLAQLADRADAESTVFIYFSGHGGRIESGPHAGQYLLPVDAVYPDDASLAQTAVSGSDFIAALAAVRARKVLVVFDCCHASGIGQPKSAATPAFKAGMPESYWSGVLRSGIGRVTLASSRSTEYSYIEPGAKYSLFTEHLLGGLQGGVVSDDGLIRIFDLFEYLQPRVTARQPLQHPVFKAELEDNFPLALYRGGQKGIIAHDRQGFRYDAYVSYADKDPDSRWVWQELVPRLEKAGLRVAVSGDVEEPGVARVVNVERGLKQSKRTIIVLSEAYLADHMTGFENVLGQTLGVQEGVYRLLPVKIGPVDQGQVPVRLSMLSTLDLTHALRAEREFERLVRSLQGPVPRA